MFAESSFRVGLRCVPGSQPLPSLWQRDANCGRGGAVSPGSSVQIHRPETRLDPEPAGRGDPPTAPRAPAAPGKHTNTLRARRQASWTACRRAATALNQPRASLALGLAGLRPAEPKQTERNKIPPRNSANASRKTLKKNVSTIRRQRRLAYGQLNSGPCSPGPGQAIPESWCNDSGICSR